MRKWKNACCSCLPSSFPESCCWKGHKSSSALKQCCYLNIQNKTQLASCYWKEESIAAKKKSLQIVSQAIFSWSSLAGDAMHATRDSSQKRGAAHCRHLPGMRKETWNIPVLFYPGLCPNWCSPESASLNPGWTSRHAAALGTSRGIKQGQRSSRTPLQAAKGTQNVLSASCCQILSEPWHWEEGDRAASRTLLQTHQISKVTALKSSCKIILALVSSHLSSCQNKTSKPKRRKPVRSLSLWCHLKKMLSL